MSFRNKLQLLIMFGLILLIFLTSCNPNSNKIKIAMMLGNMNAPRWQKDKECFLNEAQKLGCEAVVVDADFNEDLQLKQAKDLIQQGYKSIVIAAVNAKKAAEIIRYAKEHDVITIAYDGVINNCPLDYIISFDDAKIGQLMAEYAISKTKTGNYVIIGGDYSNSNSIAIRNAEQEVLSPFIKDNRIKITYSSYSPAWAQEEAYMTMKRYLQLTCGDIPSAVLVSNDNMAQGVINAFENANLPIPLITGQDASIIGCKNILSNKQAMTVYKPFKKMASMAASAAYYAAIGKKPETIASTFNGTYDVPTIHVDIVSVDKTNMESTIIADGFINKADLD